MATIIDSLLITLGLDSSGVSKGMTRAENRLASGVKNITTNILAPLAGAFALGKLISGFTQAADAAGKLAMHLRANAGDVKAWGDAVEATGGDANALNGTLSGLEETLRAAQFGPGSHELRQLGIRSRDANGNLKSSVDVLRELSLVSGKMNPEKFERLTKSLGIDAGTIRLLQRGSTEVDSLVTKYKDLAYTQKDTEIARKFNLSMGDLNKTFQIFAATGLRVIVPALTFIADKFAAVVNFLRKHEPFVKAFIVSAAALLLMMLLPVLAKIAVAALAMIAPFIPFIAIVALLALLFDDLWTYVTGGQSALSELWSVFGTGEEISQSLADAWEYLKELGSSIWEGIAWAAKKFFSYFVPSLSSLVNVFKNALKFIKALFTGDFTEIVQTFKDLWNSVGQYLVDVLSGAFNMVWDIVGSVFTGIVNFVGNIFGQITSWLKQKIKGLIEYIPDFLLPDSLIEWVNSVDDAVADAGANMAGTAAPGGSLGSALKAVSPASLAAAAISEARTENNTNMGGVTFNIKSTDPAEAARESGNELRRMAATANKGVKQ